MGDEPFHEGGRPLSFDLRSFWQWAASGLVSNALRGIVAEYLVAQAVGAASGIRTEWDACDVRTASGAKLEVKTSAYLQSWAQARPSVVSFDIAPKRAWDAATNTYAEEPCRTADLYVFALHWHSDKATIDPLDVTQWEFYVLPTEVLTLRCPRQKRLSLNALHKLNPHRAEFSALGAIIEEVWQGMANHSLHTDAPKSGAPVSYRLFHMT